MIQASPLWHSIHLAWYSNGSIGFTPPISWFIGMIFFRKIRLHFGPSSFVNHEVALFKLKQTSSLSTYLQEFESLSTRVIGLCQQSLQTISYRVSMMRSNENSIYWSQPRSMMLACPNLSKTSGKLVDPLYFGLYFIDHRPWHRPHRHRVATHFQLNGSRQQKWWPGGRKVCVLIAMPSLHRDTDAILLNSSIYKWSQRT